MLTDDSDGPRLVQRQYVTGILEKDRRCCADSSDQAMKRGNVSLNTRNTDQFGHIPSVISLDVDMLILGAQGVFGVEVDCGVARVLAQ